MSPRKKIASTPAAARVRVDAGVVGWVLVCTALVGLPVAFLNWGSMSFLDLPALGFALVACVAVFVLTGEFCNRLLRWRVAWAMAALLAWALISALQSGRVFSALLGNPGNGWGAVTLVGAAAIALAASARRRAVRDALVAVAPWLVGIEAAIATYEWRTQIWPARSFSNPTNLLLAFGVLLPMTAVMPEGASPLVRRLREVALLAGLWSVAISGARVGFVAVVVWAAWALWTGALGADLSTRVRRIAFAVFGVLAIPAGWFTYKTGGTGIAQFVSDRSARFGASWGGMLDRPIAGWGPDGFIDGAGRHVTEAMLKVTGSEFGQFGADPHSFVAWIAISLGVVGLALAAWLAFEIVRNWRKQASAGRFDTAAAWGFGLYAFQALFAPATIQTVLFALLALGISLAVERPASEKDAANPRSATASRGWAPYAGRGVQVIATLAAVVLLGYSVTRLSLHSPPEERDPVAVQRMAGLWNDPYLWYHTDLAWGWALQRNPALGAGEPDLTAIRRAVELEPGNPVYLTDLGRALAVWAKPDAEVRAAFERVYDVFPMSPDAHAAYAEYLLAKGDAKGAWIELEPVAGIESLEVWRVLAVYYGDVGQKDKAAEFQKRIDAERKAESW